MYWKQREREHARTREKEKRVGCKREGVRDSKMACLGGFLTYSYLNGVENSFDALHLEYSVFYL